MSKRTFDSNSIWIIVPGLNEHKYLDKVLTKIKSITSNIIYVDDGSSDQSVSIAKKHLQHVLVHEINLGKGAALKTGCEYAFNHLKADGVVFLDSDDQHDPQEIPRFVESLKNGNEVVFGVRKFSTASMPLLRFIGNKFASFLLVMLFNQYIPDIPSGFKALSKTGYQAVKWNSTGYEVEMEIAAKIAKAKLPFSILEIETIYHDADKGMNLLEAVKILKSLIQWRIGL